MARLTRVKDKYECRIDKCSAEDWMLEVYGHYPQDGEADICNNCPFMKYINKLAKYEDKEYEECQKAVRHVIAITDIYETTKKEYMRAAMHCLKSEFDHDLIEQEVDKLLELKGEYEA